MIPALEDKRHVVTNIPIKLETILRDYPGASIQYFDKKAPLKGDPDKFFDIETYPKGSVFIIDEFWRYFESGTQQKSMSNTQKEFFTEHGHAVDKNGFTAEIVLITQDNSHFCGFVKSLIQETVLVEKCEEIPGKPFYTCKFYDYCYPTYNGIQAKYKNTANGTYQDKYTQYYISHTNNTTSFNKGLEKKIDKRGSIWKKWEIRYGLPALAVMASYSVYAWGAFLDGINPEQNPEQVAEAPQQPVQPEIKQPATFTPLDPKELTAHAQGRPVLPADEPVPEAQAPESRIWRLEGYLLDDASRIASIVHTNGYRRVVPFDDYCQFYPGDYEAFCKIGNELVASWTGRPSINYSSVAPTIPQVVNR